MQPELRGGLVIPSTGRRAPHPPEVGVGRWGSFWKPGHAIPRVEDVASPASSYLGMAGAYGSRVPDPLPEDEPHAPEHRDNRPRYYPEVPGDYRGQPARRPHITPPPQDRLPDVPEGTLIRLHSGEWSHQEGLDPSEQVVMRVSAIHPGRPCVDVGMVWVTGHGMECSWRSSTCSRPCFDLLVSVDALWRAVGGQ